MLIGILNINKPPGITSHNIINQLRKILKIKRIGHAGTLDPAATGVLPVCIGKATRLIQYLPTDKQYIAEITLGITTDSYDCDGEITSKQEVELNEKELHRTLKKFKGKIKQEVPLASATHYKGKKLYKYAHQGIEIKDLPTKTVTIHDLQLIEIIHKDNKNPVIKLKIDCSSGTYIRSIANDLGKDLKSGAYLSKLTRTIACSLNIEQSISIEELNNIVEKNNLESVLIAPNELIDWPNMQLDSCQILKIIHGQFIKPDKEIFKDNQMIFLINKNDCIIAIGKYIKEEAVIKPEIVIMQ